MRVVQNLNEVPFVKKQFVVLLGNIVPECFYMRGGVGSFVNFHAAGVKENISSSSMNMTMPPFYVGMVIDGDEIAILKLCFAV